MASISFSHEIPWLPLAIGNHDSATLRQLNIRPFRMASGREWNGFSDQSATVDVVRRHRLAPACTHLYAADGGLIYRPSYPLSYSLFYAP
jgi:hypothetical protein